MFTQVTTSCLSCPLNASARPCPFTPHGVPSRTRLCAQGEVPSRVHFIRDGAVSIKASTRAGAVTRMAVRGARSVVCVGALQSAPSTHEVRALTPLVLCSAARAELEQWIGPGESPGRRMLMLLLAELEQRDEDAVQCHGDALGRVIRFLATCADDDLLGAAPRMVMARALGLGRETLNRTLRVLERRGLIEAPARARLRILDGEKLRMLASPS